jgi:uncharacterized membrane protein
MTEQCFYGSRMKSVVLAMLCSSAWLVTFLSLDGTTLTQAIAGGGLAGKLAIACVAFGLMAPFSLAKEWVKNKFRKLMLYSCFEFSGA